MKRPPKKSYDHRLQLFVSYPEYDALVTEYKATGLHSMSAFLRKKVIGKGIIIPDTRTLQMNLDKIGHQYERIGNNINQIAKKVNQYHMEGYFPVGTLDEYNELMHDYQSKTEELSRAYRALLRQLARN